MKVTARKKFNLSIVKEEFEILFSWTLKNGVEKPHWFTPTGKCKMWIGALSTVRIGDVGAKASAKLIKELKANKSDILQDGNKYFTTTGESDIAEITNMGGILKEARKDWEERKYVEGWVEDTRKLEY